MEFKTINNKEIFICEDHNQVLRLWEKHIGNKPFVLSFDHHTDTHRAFQYKIYHDKLDSNELLIERLKNGELSLINELKNDEHIDAAIKCDFIDRAMLFTVDSCHSRRENIINVSDYENYNTSKRIIVNNNLCCYTEISIDSEILESEFKRFELCIKPEIWKRNYILDIDLDFFHYRSSIEVNDLCFFKNLIKNSIAISIARESTWINQWKTQFDDELSVEFLEEKLLEIIDEATYNGNSCKSF